MMKNEIVFSFASSEVGPLGRAFIKITELSTGQPKLKKIYDDYIKDNRPPELFWHDAVERLNLKVNIKTGAKNLIPKTGKLLVVSNHPFGTIDGIILCSILTKIRSDVKIITHKVLAQAPAVKHQILPIDFTSSKSALINNIMTKRKAEDHLKNDGVVIIFPNGQISTDKKYKQKIIEKEWKTFASKLTLKSKSPVLPFYFEGQNSKVFHYANKIGQTFRYSVLMYELRKKMGKTINVHIGSLIDNDKIKSIGGLKEITDYLRQETYNLDPENIH